MIHTALDPELERMVRNVLVRRRDSLEGVHDAAAVLIDNATGGNPRHDRHTGFS